MDFKVNEDLLLIKKLLNASWEEMAKNIGVTPMTLNRWMNLQNKIEKDNLESIYEYAYQNKININKIYEQFFKEDYTNKNNIVLFHGSKNAIIGDISLEKCKPLSDFGQGFYCGESLEQSAMFVSSYPDSSIYFIKFNNANLKSYKFNVDQEWMLTIAYFRDTLGELKNHPIILNIIKKLKNLDYFIAPIADNKMYAIMDSFINGEITDQQCMHALSATNLGYQYVFMSKKAINNLEILYHGYLSNSEKLEYLNNRLKDNDDSENKVKIAKIKYRGKGHYIDEILK